MPGNADADEGFRVLVAEIGEQRFALGGDKERVHPVFAVRYDALADAPLQRRRRGLEFGPQRLKLEVFRQVFIKAPSQHEEEKPPPLHRVPQPAFGDDRQQRRALRVGEGVVNERVWVERAKGAVGGGRHDGIGRIERGDERWQRGSVQPGLGEAADGPAAEGAGDERRVPVEPAGPALELWCSHEIWRQERASLKAAFLHENRKLNFRFS